MTTTYITFAPVNGQPFSFTATLDNTMCKITCPWNFFGERFYINIYDSSGTLIVTRPMVGSPSGFDISLTAGYFTTALIWRVNNNQFEITD